MECCAKACSASTTGASAAGKPFSLTGSGGNCVGRRFDCAEEPRPIKAQAKSKTATNDSSTFIIIPSLASTWQYGERRFHHRDTEARLVELLLQSCVSVSPWFILTCLS